jgi:hypothetical protein
MFWVWFAIDWFNHKVARLPLVRRLPWGMARYWFCQQMWKEEEKYLNEDAKRN